MRFACVRLALVKSALLKFVPLRLAPVRSESTKMTAFKLASVKSVYLRLHAKHLLVSSSCFRLGFSALVELAKLSVVKSTGANRNFSFMAHTYNCTNSKVWKDAPSLSRSAFFPNSY